MKLIEANQAKEFASTFLADKILQAAVNAVVDNAPGFELVRCKDCKHYSRDAMFGGGYCYGAKKKLDDFCSCGERRTDGSKA